MKMVRTLFAKACVYPVVGLLALAVVVSVSHPAQAECPLPEGVTHPDNPTVTAQQVEDGSATVEEFALAVRERSREYARGTATAEQGVYIGCIIQGGRRDLAFRFHVHREPDARRQSVHSREEHGIVG